MSVYRRHPPCEISWVNFRSRFYTSLVIVRVSVWFILEWYLSEVGKNWESFNRTGRAVREISRSKNIGGWELESHFKPFSRERIPIFVLKPLNFRRAFRCLVKKTGHNLIFRDIAKSRNWWNEYFQKKRYHSDPGRRIEISRESRKSWQNAAYFVNFTSLIRPGDSGDIRVWK